MGFGGRCGRWERFGRPFGRLGIVVGVSGLTLVGMGAGLEAPAVAAKTPSAVAIPITTHSVSFGIQQDNFDSINVSVAGGPNVPVELDTGSSGLVIFSNDVGPKATAPVGPQTALAYDSGKIAGVFRRGPIKIGPLTSPTNTIFLSASTAQNSRMVAALRQQYGVEGILGVGPTDNESTFPFYSPLAQLPAPYWEGITLNIARSGSASGQLLVGPVAAPSSALSTPLVPDMPAKLANGRPAYQIEVNLCWQVGSRAAHCAPTGVDSGDTTIALDPVSLPGLPSQNGLYVDPGTTVNVSAPSGRPLWTYTAGTTFQTALTLYFPRKNFTSNTSINFFFGRSVAFNIAKGQLQVWSSG